ncbi:hypothetical protein HID58_023104, partial [Brassica napus]
MGRCSPSINVKKIFSYSESILYKSAISSSVAPSWITKATNGVAVCHVHPDAGNDTQLHWPKRGSHLSWNAFLRWRRVLLKRLKVSGAALTGDEEHNIDPKAIAREVSAVNRLGIEVAIVVGGGNISLVDPPGLGAVALTVPLLIVSGIKSILDFLVPDECVFFPYSFISVLPEKSENKSVSEEASSVTRKDVVFKMVDEADELSVARSKIVLICLSQSDLCNLFIIPGYE